MPFRFRFLEPGGREIAVEGLDELRAHILSGAVGEGTLLHDALTDDWAPAESHAVYELLSDPNVGIEDAELFLDDPSLDPSLDPVELHLRPDVPFQASSSVDVIAALLKEREAEDAEGGGSGRSGGGGFVRGDAPVDVSAWSKPETGDPYDETGDPGDEDPAPRSRRPSSPDEADTDRQTPVASSRALPPRRAPARRLRTPAAVTVLVALVAAGTVYVGVSRDDSPLPAAAAPANAAANDARGVDSRGAGGREAAAAPAPGRMGAPGILGDLAATEGEAFSDMVEAMDSLRRVHGVERVPEAWLEGRYLADAGGYPDVESYWLRYQEFLHVVRQQDTALFRQSLVRRLRADGVSGPMIPIRLASALEAFRASQPVRDGVYDHMEELAEASLMLHELLVQRAGDIEYDPVTRTRASRDPVLEAWSGDEELRRIMWLHMDRIFDALGRIHGDEAASRDRLSDQLLEGIRATGRL